MITYRIEYVPDAPMTTMEGEPAYKLIGFRPSGQPVYELDDAGNKFVQMACQLKFMLGRLSEQKFVEKLESFDAVALVVETRRELRTQEPEARRRGYWELDDNTAKRLRAATEEPRSKEQIEQKLVAYDLQHAHNWWPCMEAIKQMKKVERTAIEKPDEPAAERAAE